MRHVLVALGVALVSQVGNAAALLEIPEQDGMQIEVWDLSGDGKVLVGGCSPSGGPCRWNEASGYELLEMPGSGSAWALAASYDGSVAVGSWAAPAGDPVAVRWDADGRSYTLEPPQASVSSEAWGVSADGSVIVGWRRSGDETRAFRWTAEAGMQLSPEAGYAYGVSGDGTLVVGCCAPEGAFLWSQDGDFVPLPPVNASGDGALGISADGAVVVGGGAWEEDVAWRWTQAEGATPLGPPGDISSIPFAHDASSDGSVVVGSEYRFWGESFVWDAEHGKRSLVDALLEGYVLSGFASLEDTRAVSDDGRRIAATGIRADLSRVTVLAVLGPACDDGVDNDGDGLVDTSDPHCLSPSHTTEWKPGCGLGFELALVLPLLAARRARGRRP